MLIKFPCFLLSYIPLYVWRQGNKILFYNKLNQLEMLSNDKYALVGNVMRSNVGVVFYKIRAIKIYSISFSIISYAFKGSIFYNEMWYNINYYHMVRGMYTLCRIWIYFGSWIIMIQNLISEKTWVYSTKKLPSTVIKCHVKVYMCSLLETRKYVNHWV